MNIQRYLKLRLISVITSEIPTPAALFVKTNLTNIVTYVMIILRSIVEASMKSTLYTQTMILSARYGFIVPTASMEILLLGMLVQFQN